MKAGIVVFPGSNCDQDLYHVLSEVLGLETVFLWHKDRDLKGVDAVFLPGGFSYGDYLRSGAIAGFAPIMEEVKSFAEKGGPTLGICNGFQVLTETGLLPGVLMPNASLRFICETVTLKVENTSTPFSSQLKPEQLLDIPIAHHDGNYFLENQALQSLEDKGQVVFRYVDQEGQASLAANPNGSLNNIAGVCNAAGNVVGMMPHPERVSEALLGSAAGKAIFESLLGS